MGESCLFAKIMIFDRVLLTNQQWLYRKGRESFAGYLEMHCTIARVPN